MEERPVSDGETPQQSKSSRGFASMSPERQRQIASLGGRTAHERGTAHCFTSAEGRAAGQIGGVQISQDRDHMASIGRRGGEARGRRLVVVEHLKNFSRHQLEQIGARLHLSRQWRCAAPGSSVYSFTFISQLGSLVIAGASRDLLIKRSGWGHEWQAPPTLRAFTEQIATGRADQASGDRFGEIAIYYAALLTFLRLLDAERRPAELRSASCS